MIYLITKGGTATKFQEGQETGSNQRQVFRRLLKHYPFFLEHYGFSSLLLIGILINSFVSVDQLFCCFMHMVKYEVSSHVSFHIYKPTHQQRLASITEFRFQIIPAGNNLISPIWVICSALINIVIAYRYLGADVHDGI